MIQTQIQAHREIFPQPQSGLEFLQCLVRFSHRMILNRTIFLTARTIKIPTRTSMMSNDENDKNDESDESIFFFVL
ncbi:GSCOCG00004804001-RA-CDS [Cotesia congregata]|nr:GSCOCG00004804001-RA-CDS [Cotesia congregata]